MDPAIVQAIAQAATNAAEAAVHALAEHQPPAHQVQPAHDHKLNLPPFWTNDPSGWFSHAEAKFLLMRYPVNSHICYLHVVGSLQQEVLLAVRDVTRDVTADTENPYLVIKEALLARFTKNPLQLCYELLELPPLGDRRPSALYAQIQALVPVDGNLLLNAIFLRLLPQHMRDAISDKAHYTPRELANAADNIYNPTTTNSIAAVKQETPTVAAATHQPRRPTSRSPSRQQRHYQQNKHQPRRNSPRRPSPARKSRLTQPPHNSDLCIFHYNFRDKAYKCVKPCSWSENY
jgi:hypothetical protein